MTTSLPKVGDLFLDRYELESVIGFGGYGRVYLARQSDLRRNVALKVVQPPERDDDDDRTPGTFVERFEREAQAISQLRDPHTIVMHDYGATDSGLFYMVLEYIDGIALMDAISNGERFSPERTVRILEQVLSSLREAHMLGLVHRDVKPGNIMLYEHLGQPDRVKLLDFGLAKSMSGSDVVDDRDLTAADMLVGTPRYMAPEQVRGERIGAGTDLYALGLVTMEMLTGERTVNDASAVSIVARHIDPKPFDVGPIDAPAGLKTIVSRMVEKDPRFRYQSAQEVLDDLVNWDRVEVPIPVGNRNKAAVIAGAILLLLVVGTVAAFAFGGSGAVAPERAEPQGEANVLPPTEEPLDTAPGETEEFAIGADEVEAENGEAAVVAADAGASEEVAETPPPVSPKARKSRKKPEKIEKKRSRNLVILE